MVAGGAAVGALFVSKMSAPLIAPIALIMVVMRMWSSKTMVLAIGGPAFQWR